MCVEGPCDAVGASDSMNEGHGPACMGNHTFGDDDVPAF